jgi:hypothetical protein
VTNQIKIQTNGPCTITVDGDAQVIEPQPEPSTEAWRAWDWHIHSHGCPSEHTVDELLQLLAEQNLSGATPLVWGLGKGWTVDRPLLTGSVHPLSTRDHILRFDCEYSQTPSAHLGHLVTHNIEQMWFGDATGGGDPSPATTIPIAKWAKRQGAVLGMAHCQQWPASDYPNQPNPLCPWEAPILAALGLLDYLSTEYVDDADVLLHPGTQVLWTHLLNCGFRLGLVGSSDFSCLQQPPGSPRTLVKTLGNGYKKALAETEIGASVVSRGDNGYLEMTVNGAPVGSRIDAVFRETVAVEVRTDQPVDQVHLMLGSEPYTSIPIVDGMGSFTAGPLGKSSYLHALTENFHTSAIYFRVDEKPIRVKASIEWMIGYVDHLTDLVHSGAFGEAAKAALPHYAAARAEYVRRLGQAEA